MVFEAPEVVSEGPVLTYERRWERYFEKLPAKNALSDRDIAFLKSAFFAGCRSLTNEQETKN